MNNIKFRAWNGSSMIHIESLYFFEEEGIHEVKNGKASGLSCDYDIMQYTGYNYKDTGEEMYVGDVVYIPGQGNCEICIDIFYGITAKKGRYEIPLIDCIAEGDYPVKLGNKYENPELLS